MTVLTVRGLSDETHRALKLRARSHGRSVEAEMRRIIADALQPEYPGIGTRLASFWRENADFDLHVEREYEAPRSLSFDEA